MPTIIKIAIIFLLYIAKQLYVNYKMATERKVKNCPASTSLMENLSIYTTFDRY
jgi:hypothetical protein